MAEKSGSQSTHNGNAWKKAVDEHAARIEGWQQEYAKIEAKAFDQAREAVDETSKLARAGVDLYADLSAAWRQLAVEALRRSADLMSPRI